MSVREIQQGRVGQGEHEQVTYTLNAANWGANPTSPSMTVTTTTGQDVTERVVSGTMGIDGDVIQLQTIGPLAPNQSYKVEVRFTTGAGSPYEAFFWIDSED